MSFYFCGQLSTSLSLMVPLWTELKTYLVHLDCWLTSVLKEVTTCCTCNKQTSDIHKCFGYLSCLLNLCVLIWAYTLLNNGLLDLIGAEEWSDFWPGHGRKTLHIKGVWHYQVRCPGNNTIGAADSLVHCTSKQLLWIIIIVTKTKKPMGVTANHGTTMGVTANHGTTLIQRHRFDYQLLQSS